MKAVQSCHCSSSLPCSGAALRRDIRPGGKKLRTHGKATIVFDLSGTLCKHDFTVVEGKPLFLLGNDFLDAWRAIISFNQNGMGGGSIQLTSLRRGIEVQHKVDVTCNYALWPSM